MCNQLINNKIDLREREEQGEGRVEKKKATSWLYVSVSLHCMNVSAGLRVQ